MRILGSITVFYENMNELLERLTAIFGILSYAVSEKQRILGILEPMTGFDENRNRRCEICRVFMHVFLASKTKRIIKLRKFH